MDEERNPGAVNAGANNSSGSDERERTTYFLSPRLGAAKRHPLYHRILQDAYAMLRANFAAIAGEITRDEICRPEYVWSRRNVFGSAVCRARDALAVRNHGVANHLSTVRDLKRLCCGGKRREVV